ncbi:MAG: histidine phosphatase family protein [Bacteroidota bacterium]|nr:histidine phosphatase family protein [Bacteroidota bacterium]
MKHLVLMRHAKASKEFDGTDYDRNLVERGKNDARSMGELLKKLKYSPEFIVSSPAKRALKTAQIVNKILGLKPSQMELDTHIYEAELNDLLHVIRSINDQYKKVMLVGHNPSITSLVGYLTPTFVEQIPTSGIVIVEFETETWKMIQQQSGKLIWSQNPHKLPLL